MNNTQGVSFKISSKNETFLLIFKHCVKCTFDCREYAHDEDVLNEALIAGWVVVKGREKYQKNTFGHGLIMLKQSVIEEKLRRNTEYTQHRHEAFKILQNAVGHRILEEMLQELKIQKI